MARIRSLKPEAFTSESLAKVSVSAERTFFGLSTIADDRGRLADKPAQINGDLWSMRGAHTASDLEGELEELVKADELVCRYTGCNGKRYLHLVTWDWHQKIDHPGKSRLPRCPHHLFSVASRAEECGLHEGECADFSFGPREDSRELREESRGVRPGSSRVASDAGDGGIAGQDTRKGTPGAQVPEQAQSSSSRSSRESSRGVATDLGPRTVDLGTDTPSAVAGKPATRTPRKPSGNTGDVIAAYVEGATSVGQPRPPETLRKRVGKQANELLAEGYELAALVAAARRMGTGEWNDLAVQVRKDAAGANGKGPAPGAGKQTNYTDEEYRSGW